MKNIYKHIGFNSDLYFTFIFIISCLIHFIFATKGWNNALLDYNSFRETQTAISAFYFLKEGFTLNYITPILGAPWSIPLEFPLFQWIVAGIRLITNYPLDQTGRLVSLIFFYASLPPIYSLLKYFVQNKSDKLIILSLILVNPIYIFWSRAFLIESFALFLSLMFLWSLTKSLDKKYFFICTIIFGVLGAIVKITTFAPLCIPGVAIVIHHWLKNNKRIFSIKTILYYCLVGIITFGIPLIATIKWTHYADDIKNLNPFAQNWLNSENLRFWVFGDLKQRLSIETWDRIFDLSIFIREIFGVIQIKSITIINFYIIYLFFIIFSKKYRIKILLASLFFLSAPLIFTNLYFVHDYYPYANNFLLCIVIGLMIISIIRSNKFKIGLISKWILPPLILILSFYTYTNHFYQFQTKNPLEIYEAGQFIKNHSKESDIILIYGYDWNPAITYYAERKSLTDRTNLSISHPKVQTSLKTLGQQKITTMVIVNTKSDDFIKERVKYFKFDPQPKYMKDSISIYQIN